MKKSRKITAAICVVALFVLLFVGHALSMKGVIDWVGEMICLGVAAVLFVVAMYSIIIEPLEELADTIKHIFHM